MAYETALKCYEVARAEMLERMRLRDLALTTYLGGAAALSAWGMTDQKNVDLYVLVVPFLAAAAAMIIGHHTQVSGALGAYCALELAPSLERGVPLWDSSRQFEDAKMAAIRWRQIAEFFLVVGPAAWALKFSWDQRRWGWWWGVGVGLTVLAMVLLGLSAYLRGQLLKKVFTEARYAGAAQIASLPAAGSDDAV